MQSRNNLVLWGRKISNYVSKQRKGIIAVICAVLFLMQSVFGVYAGETTFQLQGYEMGENIISISSSVLLQEDADTNDFEVSLGGHQVPVTNISTVGKEQKTITYYCLVDVSGSMRENQMEQIREMLKYLGSALKNGDNMVIATLGNQTTDSGFLTEQAQIAEVVEQLVIGREDTNLYAGIVTSLDRLAEAAEANQEKCLLIFSDGKDDQKIGITQKEALDKVKQTNIPVYTTAFVRDTEDSEQLEMAKLLGSFARSSAGGKHFVPDLDGLPAEDVIQEIISTEQEGMILTADISQISVEKDILLLRVIYTASDQSRKEDVLEVFGQDIKDAQVQEQEKKKDIGETETQKPDSDEEVEKDGMHILFVIVAIVLVAGIVIWAVIMRKKRQKQIQESTEEKTPEEALTKADIQEEKQQKTEGLQKGSQLVVNAEAEFSRKCVLKLTAIGYKEICWYITLEEGKRMTLGRDKRADIIIGDGDKKISGIHCAVKWENGTLYVWDLDSTNGTFVNGVPIQGMGKVAVHEGEVIRIGTYEYRITRE